MADFDPSMLLYFSTDEVQEKAGKKPWTRNREFGEEIDVDDMANTANAYSRAFGEGTTAGNLAQRATAGSQEAGSQDGGTIVDGEDRTEHTFRELQHNGEDMGEVTDYLVRAMRRAVQARDDVEAVIIGEGTSGDGLQTKYNDHVQAAVTEWNGWQSALSSAFRAGNAGNGRSAGDLAVPYNGESITVSPSENSMYALPESLAMDIREKHLGRAADDATSAYGDIVDEIDKYRMDLAGYGVELGELGYDLSDGPLGLWTTEEMADWAADGLSEELGRDHPDSEKMLRYTEALDAIVAGIYEDPNNPGDPTRQMTASELAYLEKFYGQLDADDLSALGKLKDDNAGLEPGEAGWQLSSVERVANGLTMLTNPDAGGLDPSTEEGRERIPDAIRPFVYDYEDGAMFSESPGSEAFADDLKRFNGFGDLMSTATVASGDQLSKDLATAAVDVQRMSSLQYNVLPGEDSWTENTGSSGMLRAAALNDIASAELLSDDTFRDDLLSQHWEDSTGAADLIRSGTTVPEGVDRDSQAGMLYREAAHEVLASAGGDHQDDILGKNSSLPDDHTELQGALADTTLMHMDDVANYGDNSGIHYAREERQGIFNLMAETEPAVNEGFKAGVNQIQYSMAHDYYTGAVPEANRESTFNNVGYLTALVNEGETSAIDEASDGKALSNSLAKASVGSALWAASLAPGPQQIPVGLAGAGYFLIQPMLPTYDAQAPLEDFEHKEGAINRQTMDRAVAQAAIDAYGADQELPEMDTDYIDRIGAGPNEPIDNLIGGIGHGVTGDVDNARQAELEYE
jgi:hypothetical protein